MIETKTFGRTLTKETVSLYIMTNANGMKAAVTDLGAILVSLTVPNDKGEMADVVLGYDRASDYLVNGSCFGASIGPVANRTANAEFELEGTTYTLLINDNNNNLHSDGERGLHKVLWKAEKDEEKNAVSFTVSAKDGQLGFPGNRTFKITYALSDDNALSIRYQGKTDKTTVMNLTNHSYFNLKGEDSEQTIEDELVWLKASRYTPVVKGAIPTGELAPVAGTPFDFTTEKMIRKEIDVQNAQLALVDGYDHNFVIDEYQKGRQQLVATLRDEKAGRKMEVYTDLPGIQLYTGNNMAPEFGKEGHYYPRRGGVCFETQYFPNSLNEKNFEKPVVTPDEGYDTTTVYKFV